MCLFCSITCPAIRSGAIIFAPVGTKVLSNSTSPMPRSRRVANQRAVDLLANKETIADDDVLQVLRLWLFKQNKNRQNVLPLGATSVHSDTLGLVRSRMGRVVATRFTKQYPAVSRSSHDG